MALEAVLGRGRVEGLAVVELHAGAQLDGDGQAVGATSRGSVASCGTTSSFSSMSNSLSQIEREDDAADIGARQSRIEHVGILGEPDAQVRLGRGAAARDDRRTPAPARGGSTSLFMLPPFVAY